ncbi:SDR family NAD(P)-dependent oxidoreductase [Allosediminivita pacifica]|uniref:NAD(P)-dependent dehydrogenase (Short-subunit alcohol dehydrogenase family) n=1 Tax=Allosediminivita pacifica TaxID=1267769 RepID=A0A2T6ARK7_9RHOB|nr:SDR family NAD(P)-dependent oxidoreductase [Allosediminivita pacifica]PTX46453.1 NAD(P)-dependent dehydrogenase (short-subunit alcohol dehydrogenase family) [Allosediminivita pacifica]GGB17076.1 short-chain dehydrogenase [Allosediminivita pacifica]
MQIDLYGKTALVTGSTKGIGLATAKGLAASGAKVVVNGRKQHDVDVAVTEVQQHVPGAEVSGIAADLGSAEGCKTVTDALPDCDVLVNNAGIFKPEDFFEVPDETWQQFYDVNVMSGVRLARHYLPGMQNREWGRVVFLSSESAFNIPPEMIHYGMTKTAVTAVARGLAKRMAGTGVTVNSVMPGPTLSEGVAAMLKDDMEKNGKSLEEAGRDMVMSDRPSSILQRPASVEEVANMIVYTCSPLASATTGAALRVEGGIVDTL